jgi:hypothetical protein
LLVAGQHRAVSWEGFGLHGLIAASVFSGLEGRHRSKPMKARRPV